VARTGILAQVSSSRQARIVEAGLGSFSRSRSSGELSFFSKVSSLGMSTGRVGYG